MARHGANYASPCRLGRLRSTKMARPGTPYWGGDCGHKIRASVRLSFDRRRQRMLYRTVCVRMRTVDAFWSRCLFVAHSFVAYKLQALLHVKPLPSLRFKPLIMYSSISINVSHYKCKPETLSRVIYGILLAA